MADQTQATVYAGWLEGRVHLHQHDRAEIAAELRRLDAVEAERDALRAEAERANADAAAALGLVSRIRWAIGDNGTRMQDELVEFCRTTALEAADVYSLRAEVERLKNDIERYVQAASELGAEVERLRAEVERLTAEVTRTQIGAGIDAAINAARGAA